MNQEILYSFSSEEHRVRASIPTLARQDAVIGYEPIRYVLIEDKAVQVRRGGGRNYYFRYSENLGRNEVIYFEPTEMQIHEFYE